MPITLPDSLGHRLAPFAMQLGLSVDEMATQLLDDWLSWKEAEAAIIEADGGSAPATLEGRDIARIWRAFGLDDSGPHSVPPGTTCRDAFLADVRSVAAQLGRTDAAAAGLLVRDVEETLNVLRWLPEVGEPPVGPTDVPAGVRRTPLRTVRDFDIYYRTAGGVCEVLRLLKRPTPACPLTSE